jgi:hypothetical protein
MSDRSAGTPTFRHALGRRVRAVIDRWIVPSQGFFNSGRGARCEVEPTRRPDPPAAARSHVLLVLDSCRFDSFVAAKPKNFLRLGPLSKRWSYASWTAPSHYNMLLGLYPHENPRRTFAADYYRAELSRMAGRLGFLGVDGLSSGLSESDSAQASTLDLGDMAPSLWLPSFLRDVLGYHTGAIVSLPVLNPATPLNRGFCQYELMQRHDDLPGMIGRMRFYAERPSFYLLNSGETHYPYGPEHEGLPRLHGLHGVVRHLDGSHPGDGNGEFFDDDTLRRLKARQVDAVRRVDEAAQALFDVLPKGTFLTVTADHGELFGEDGCFGHGPFRHPKVFEVPLLEGRVG